MGMTLETPPTAVPDSISRLLQDEPDSASSTRQSATVTPIRERPERSLYTPPPLIPVKKYEDMDDLERDYYNSLAEDPWHTRTSSIPGIPSIWGPIIQVVV